MSALSAKRDGDTVTITVEIGDKRARLRVTREYAKQFARELLTAAHDSNGNAPLDDIRATMSAIFGRDIK
jgi:hypothetical protein